MAARGVFIAGTDTGVGKTHVAAAIVRALARSGRRVTGMKPVAAGADPTPEGLRNADAVALVAAGNVSAPYVLSNPYCLPVPASPHIAAEKAGICIECTQIVQSYGELAARSDVVIVEGAGGWLAPIGPAETMEDVAAALGLPVILVVGLRLGCLNHALLTARAIESRGLPFAGWVANAVELAFEHAAANVAALERRLRAPLLDSVAFNQSAFAAPAAVRRLEECLRLW